MMERVRGEHREGGKSGKMIYDLIKALTAAQHFGAGVGGGVRLRVDWLSFEK